LANYEAVLSFRFSKVYEITQKIAIFAALFVSAEKIYYKTLYKMSKTIVLKKGLNIPISGMPEKRLSKTMNSEIVAG